MDIREHYITSFFFHIIILLLAAALSRSHPGAVDIFSVSLSADTFGKSSVVAQGKVEGPPKVAEPVLSAISENGAVDETEDPIEKEKIPAEEKSESVSTNDKISETSLPAASDAPGPAHDTMWLAQIHHTYYSQAGAFMDSLSQSITKGLHREIEMDSTGGLREGAAQVTFYFDDEGGLGEIWGATDSLELKSALNHLDWRTVPLPGSYRLRIKGLLVKIRIANGEPMLTVTML